MNKLYIILLMFAITLGACQKKNSENMIPDGVPGLPELQKQYMDKLVASEEGWYIDYQPSNGLGIVSLLVKFHADGTAGVLSDYTGFTEEQTNVRYRIGGVIAPELIFETYSAWHAIAENMGGAFEFQMVPETNGTISLKRINSSLKYTLRKATAANRTDLQAKSTTVRLLETFSKNANGYFKNLVLTKIAAFWEINPAGRTIKLTWLDASGAPTSAQYAYSNIENGIVLTTKWKVGNIEVDKILFGQSSENELEIVDAGNAGSGKIAVAHIPAFPYKGTSDYFIQKNGAVRFFGYTLDLATDYYSPALIPSYNAFKNAVGAESLRLQLYNNNNVDPALNNSAQFRYAMPNGGATGFMVYYYGLEKKDDSHVVVTPFGTSNALGAPYLSKANDFLSLLFPPEGVTIVPFGRAGALQKIRIISRKDSKYYATITVSTPAGVFVD